MKSFFQTLIFFGATSVLFAAPPRIEWDHAAVQHVQPGVYARLRVLRDGRWALVSSNSGYVTIAFSSDRGATWGSAQIVARASGYNLTNSELLELDNGTLLYAFNARPLRREGGALPYVIRTTFSSNGGRTWAPAIDAFVGGKVFGDGCWEPAMIQLPSDEVQLFFANEAPYTHSDEQEISLLTSHDRGKTWSAPSQLSFRPHSRDGMPVPLMLRGKDRTVVAIEDNGLSGNFKPVILRSGENHAWTNAPIGAESPSRHAALSAEAALTPATYAGAPYLAQFPSGETALVVQSSEGRSQNSAEVSAPVVYLGDDEAQNFGSPTRPLNDLPAEASGDWNSLTAVGENEIVLVSSVSLHRGPSEIWLVRGRLLH